MMFILEPITKHMKVSFSVVDEDTIVSEAYTSYFRSVIAFGKARITEENEWLEAFKALVEKYSSDQPEEAKHNEIIGCRQTHIIAIDVDHITGKEAIEYIKAKEQ